MHINSLRFFTFACYPLMESIWSQNVIPTLSRFIFAVYFAFGSFAVRLLLDKYVYQRLSIWLMSKGDTKLKMNKATRVKIAKITESMWKLTYYATVEFCVLAIAYHEPWFKDITAYFKGWPDQELKFSLELVYMCQCGFYIYSMAALLLWETRRKDFSVMMSHHIITVFLIGYSYITRFFRIGSAVLAVHDASDVFLEGAKILKYSGKELGASVLFGMFAVSWLILRLIIFPFWVIRASSIHLLDALRPSEVYDMIVYYIFNTLLLNLLVFHIYWWILIFNMIMRQLKNRGELGEDIRSVLAVHDASDVFLEGAKILKYSGKELGASVLFGMFAVSWLILRLIIFPFWVIRASSIHLLDALRPSEVYDMIVYYIFNTLLLNLLVFHIYWWILIFNMIMRQLKNRGELGEDIRSDSEDDD